MTKRSKLPKKIHIIGSIGSGKTTLAKNISSRLKIPYFELDNIVWQRFDTGDIRRTEQERDAYLSTVITKHSWIIEGVHHKWVGSSFQQADLIIFLDTKISTRKLRILKRFCRQKIRLEQANYRPTFKILKDLYKYDTIFEDKSKVEIFDMLIPYKNKLIIVKNSIEIINYLDTMIDDF